MSVFPYKPRRYQQEIMDTITACLADGKHFIMEAPAGSGKTIASLTSCLSFAAKHDMGVLYLTRTNSQQKQAIWELGKIAERLGIRAVSIQGRMNMCLLVDSLSHLREKTISNEEIARLCAVRKKRSLAALKGEEVANRCAFFERFLETKDDAPSGNVLSAEELRAHGKEYGICAYELNKALAKKADVLIAPYIYVFDDFLREKFLAWFPHPPEETILIIDEAHNLPDFCRELLSFSLSLRTVHQALREVEEYAIREEDIRNLLTSLKNLLEHLDEMVEFSENDDVLLSDDIITRSLAAAGMDGAAVQAMAEKMMTYGDIVADIKESHNMIPRSFVRSAGMFLLRWLPLTDRWVRIAERGEDNIWIEAYCLDASIASSIITSFYASVHMSGTLQPLQEYRDSIGIAAEIRAFPSPFPEENRLIMYVEGVNTRYYMSEEMTHRIAQHLETICNSIGRNALVLFPSYAVMNRFLKTLHIDGAWYVEERGERQHTLMKKLRQFKRNGGVFLSVMGGRLSEGIDFPSEELEMVLIVGIPYPPPSAKQQALLRYYDRKYGNGWRYVMEAQAIRKIMQSIGRLIRNEDDRGVAVILDERACRFSRYIPMKRSTDPVKDIRQFFAKVA